MYSDKFYKGKYLIVCYDKNGFIKEIADKPRDIKSFKLSTIQELCAKILKGYKHNSVYLVDVSEIHNDKFKEADEDFLRFINDIPHKTNREYCKALGINERTYYRKKRLEAKWREK